jgi:hypothetical protein
MDEQRILEEMERSLANEDPRLASRLGSFGQSRLRARIRSPRARLLIALLSLALIVAVTLMMYSLSPFRLGSRSTPRPTNSHTIGAPGGARPGSSSNQARDQSLPT